MFLESRIALLVLAAFVEFWLLWAWARRRTRRTRRLALGGLLAAPLLVVVQALVVTERERIVAVCHKLARAVEAGDVDGFGAHIADGFADGSIDRDRLLASLTRALARVRVEEARLSGFKLSVDGARGQVDFQAGCRLVAADFIDGRVLSRWKLSFVLLGGEWRVIAIQPVPTPTFPYQSLRETLGAW